MQSIVVQSAQVMMRRITRPFVLEDRQLMPGFRVHERNAA